MVLSKRLTDSRSRLVARSGIACLALSGGGRLRHAMRPRPLLEATDNGDELRVGASPDSTPDRVAQSVHHLLAFAPAADHEPQKILFFFLILRHPPNSTLFPDPPLSR